MDNGILKVSTVSVVSVVYNRAKNVARWLDSLSRQIIPLEVILVNYGSTDGLEAVLQASPGQVSVITLDRSDDSLFHEAYLKNVGIRQATGEVIVATNNDVTYEPAFFKQIA